jgi:hypothetical protein
MARRSDALVPALIGLTGVLIGALVTAGITYLGDRAHRIADKRTAKRLISNEVRLDTQRLIVVSALGRLPGAQPRTVQWESQAPTLARYVSSRDWSQVSAFYDDLLNLEHSLLRRPCVSVGTWRLATTVAKSGNAAYMALERRPIPAISNLRAVYPCRERAAGP